jgi:hypothetical protein
MGAAEDFFRWNDEARRLAAQRDRMLDPHARRRLERRIEAAELRAFASLRCIARAVRDRRDDVAVFWDAIVDHAIDGSADA